MKNIIKGLVWLIALAGFGIGLYGVFLRVTTGHRLADYGSYIPWGLWVTLYLYFIGLSAGTFLFSSFVYVAKIEKLRGVGKLTLFTAFGCLVAALFSIWMDLGHMERVGNVILHMNLHSMMSWMGILYSAYIVLILVELWFALRIDLIKTAQTGQYGSKFLAKILTFGSTDTSDTAEKRDHTRLRILATVGIPLAIAFDGGVGALFGVVQARPFWHGGLTPIAVLIGVLVSGGALLTAIIYIWGPSDNKRKFNDSIQFLGRIVLALILFDCLLEISEILVKLYSVAPAERRPIEAILSGQYWYVFWIIHVLLGVIIPVGILFAKAVPKGSPEKSSSGAIAFACILVAVTFFAVRFNIVIPGLIDPEIHGLQYAFTGPGLKFTYLPTMMEWLVSIWVTSVGILVFLLGEKLLPIVKPESEEVA